jgi:hypothetical protein
LIEFTFGNGSAVVIQIRTLRNDANCFTLRADNWLGQKLKTMMSDLLRRSPTIVAVNAPKIGTSEMPNFCIRRTQIPMLGFSVVDDCYKCCASPMRFDVICY